MAMAFCKGCGKEIHETALTCPNCGAPQAQSLKARDEKEIPDGVKGWSWGAFLLNWIWAIGNKTWIGLLALVPYVGIIMALVLGFKGREWAWKNKEWENIDHFNRVQKKWSKWGFIIVAAAFVIGIIAAIGIPAYEDYSQRAKQEAEDNAFADSQESGQVIQSRSSAYAPPPVTDQPADTLGKMREEALAEYDRKWNEISRNPEQFIAKCTAEEAQLMIDLSGHEKGEAIKTARSNCILQLTELEKCMGQSDSNATDCFTDVFERGG